MVDANDCAIGRARYAGEHAEHSAGPSRAVVVDF
jgi:hypothetical protein